ncbi:PKD domain-containing protein [Vibrio barjaei]|uniref:PKD domain-containing protein n=1 Tax=Vibrio barjaei TaxID=1676683 RepID=UPI00228390B7|nr:hypothetical protein [Vibrio barjaei]MCY9870447.1 hypothetical protein [Vibrio barjaei]
MKKTILGSLLILTLFGCDTTHKNDINTQKENPEIHEGTPYTPQSTIPENAINVKWSQVEGPETTYSRTNRELTILATPWVSSDTNITFMAEYTVEERAETDIVSLTIKNEPTPSVIFSNIATQINENSNLIPSLAITGLDADPTFLWEQTDQSNYQLTISDPTSHTPTITIPDVDFNTEIELTVTIDDGTGNVISAVSKLNIIDIAANQPPTVSIEHDSSYRISDTINLIVTASDPDGDNQQLTYQWIQTSGSQILSIQPNEASQTLIAPTVLQNENYELQLTTTDTEGDTTISIVQFSIMDISTPAAKISGPSNVAALGNLTLTATTEHFDETSIIWNQIQGDPLNFTTTPNSITINAPNLNEVTTYAFEAIATDGTNTIKSEPFTFTVNANRPATIANIDNTNSIESSSFSLTPTVDDPDGDNSLITYLWSQTSNPNSLSFNPNSKTLVLTTPQVLSDEIYEFTLSVTDENLNVTTETFSLTVVDEGRPTVSITGPTEIPSATQFTLTSVLNDPNADISNLTLEWSISSGPTDIAFSNESTQTHIAPNKYTNQTYTINLTVTDETGLSASDTIEITIGPDLDNDGTIDTSDTDIDGDGTLNDADECPTDNNHSVYINYYQDNDGDGLGYGDPIPTCPDDAEASWVLNNNDLPEPEIGGNAESDPHQLLDTKLTKMLVDDPSLSTELQFGRDVKMSDNGLVLAVLSDVNVTVFRRDSTATAFNYTTDQDSGISGDFAHDISGSNGKGWDDNEVIISLSGDGNVLAIGDRAVNTVYLYSFHNSQWTLTDTIHKDDLDLNSASDIGFGTYVDLNENGSYLAISTNITPYIQSSNTHGKVLIMNNNSPLTGTWSLSSTISDEIELGDNFGSSATMNSNASLIVIGASQRDSDVVDSGIATVYERTGNDWNLLQSLEPSNPEEDSAYGLRSTISDNGDVIVIAAPNADGTSSTSKKIGSLEIFLRDNGDSWTSKQVFLTGDDGSDSARFGISLDASYNGMIIIAGGPEFKDSKNVGRAFIVQYSTVTDTWVTSETLDSQEVDNNERFGSGVAVSSNGKWFAIGARGDRYNIEGNPNADYGTVWSNKEDLPD